MLPAKMLVLLALCLNTLAHVEIIQIADLVSTMSTKDVFGATSMVPDFAKNQTIHALLH